MSRSKYFDIEKIMKGAANHRRVEILFLLKKSSDLSTDGIVELLKINYQTGAMHVQRLVKSGLVEGYRQGSTLLHKLSPLGRKIMDLLINI